MSILSALNRLTGSLLGTSPELPVVGTTSSPENSHVDYQYCRTLLHDAVSEADPVVGWKRMEDEMALVPSGTTFLMPFAEALGSEEPRTPEAITLGAFYMDRYAVSNQQFYSFVRNGGYHQEDLWPPEILPCLLQFVDQTGNPGPLNWVDGQPPCGRFDHPVVGICWYEALAFAKWAGKQLPNPAQWQRAASWSSQHTGSEAKYPWGNSFDPSRANLWLGGAGDSVPVSAHYDGATRNGIFQLIGNVWEWVAAVVQNTISDDRQQVVFQQPMGEIRGGAFDTYFPTQATCQFRSAQPLLSRLNNLGFRCCVSVDNLQPPPLPSSPA